MSSDGSVGCVSMTITSDNCSTNVSTEKMSLTSSTLKRNPKMELSRSDLLRLLSILEGELQAREIVIAVLKAEQIKKLLYPNKFSVKSSFSSKTIKMNENFNSKPNDSNLVEYCDPWNALSRDAFGAYDPSFDKTTTIALFNMKMTQLEALITQQRRARNVLKDQLRIIESKCNTIVEELEREKRLNNETQNRLSGQSINSTNIKLETELKTMAQTLENERNREKQIVLCLLSERKQLIIKLIEERQRNEELLNLLTTEKGKIAEMVEGLEDESKRSLQMEAELEKYLNDFEGEREKFRNQLSASETRNAELAAEVDRLRQQLSGKQNNALTLGEGVRSAIVTMTSATRCVQTVPSVSTVSQPRASLAQHVSSKPLSNVNSSQNQMTIKTKSSESAQHSYATVQPISSVKMNATIPPPPSVPAPPPKALLSNSSKLTPNPVSQTAKMNAFQNMTYNLEPISSNSGLPLTTTASPSTSDSQSNNSINSRPKTANTSSVTKVMVESSQTASSQSSAVQSALHPNQPIQRKLSASGVGRGTPPPIPPNKPIIKPVLPPQALQQRSKDLNSTKVMTASVGTPPAKIVSAVNSTTNANTPTNSIKNTTINSSDSTGEQNNGRHNNKHNENSPSNSSDTNSVDILCQELENFNSVLVSMVSTASQKNS